MFKFFNLPNQLESCMPSYLTSKVLEYLENKLIGYLHNLHFLPDMQSA